MSPSSTTSSPASASTTGFEKPHPEAFAAGRCAAGKAETIWMIGDNPTADVAGAEAVGIPAILARKESASVRRAATLDDVVPILESEPQ